MHSENFSSCLREWAIRNIWLTGNIGVPLAGNTPTSNIFNANTNQMNGFGYDAAGNLQSANGNTASYDAENELVSVTEAPAFGGGTETLVYDGQGRRVQKLLSGGTTVYVYDAFGQLAAEYSSVTAPAPPCTTCYLSYDHLGSVRLVTDQNANVISRHDYLPFGEEISGGTAGRGSQWDAWDGVSQRFTGQVRDSETGEDYFNARYFTGALGRFNSPDEPLVDQDPEDPQSWNLYGYVRNNPIANIDRWGLDCVYAGNYSQTGTVGIQRGDCTQAGGVYVDGTIDTNSLTYNPDNGQLSFSYTKGSVFGSGIIGNVQGPPSDSDDIDPFGAGVVRSLGARTSGSYQLMGVFAAGSLLGGASIANGLALSGSGVADGVITQTSQYLSKAGARALAQRLAATPAQAAAAASAISRATTGSSVKVFKDGTRLIVQIVRLGADGYQEFESVIDQAGGKDVVQKAVNNAGNLVHYDPK